MKTKSFKSSLLSGALLLSPKVLEWTTSVLLLLMLSVVLLAVSF